MYQCERCGAELLRWSWWEHPRETIWYWYCLECDLADRHPFIFIRQRPILIVACNYDQAALVAKREGLSKPQWRYIHSLEDFYGYVGASVWLGPGWYYKLPDSIKFYLEIRNCVFYYP